MLGSAIVDPHPEDRLGLLGRLLSNLLRSSQDRNPATATASLREVQIPLSVVMSAVSEDEVET